MTASIDVIILTASIRPEDEHQLGGLTKGFLRKPLNSRELYDKIIEVKNYDPQISQIYPSVSVNRPKSTSAEALPDAIATPEDLNLNLNIDLNSLIEKLDHAQQGEWKTLIDVPVRKEIKKFIDFLLETAPAHHCSLLLNYGEELELNFKTYQFDQLSLNLQRFPEIIDQIKSLTVEN
ncbi:MAG: hypothetical protein HC796_03135 [Synechococcaceae cyanobacterium RL_1_2]|nr:hypothetical protein [Synechococcaceae cyanobacterium RL_1_2]